MVRRDRNHPSILMWSIGNEIPDRSSPTGLQLARQLAAAVHALDPGSGRVVTSAFPHVTSDKVCVCVWRVRGVVTCLVRSV